MRAVRHALDVGYRLIDTAEIYGDGGAERVIGEALRGFGAGRRSELFLTSKVDGRNATHRGTVRACEASIERMGCDYLDLYLLHGPEPRRFAETQRGFDELLQRGLVRRVGVSNFSARDLEEWAYPVCCNQVRYSADHPHIERELLPYHRRRGIHTMAYSPLGRGILAQHPFLLQLAEQYGLTAAQIALAWCLHDPGIVVIPKSADPRRLEQNLQADSVRLSPEDIKRIGRLCGPPSRWLPLDGLKRLRRALTQPARVTVSPPRRDQNGFWIHDVRSPYQAGSTRIRVLLPEPEKSPASYPVVYVLPVEARDGSHYGDGLREVQQQHAHNRYRAIFVAPTFSHIPWYADHPSNRLIRQETYLLDVVVPFVDRTYPVIAQPQGRLLLGFSKSGWGAWSLLLRHPQVFGRAAPWDAPVMMEWPSQFDSAAIFGTRENFELYQVRRLLREKRGELGSQCRLWLAGYRTFRSHLQELHALLEELQIRHEYRDGPDRAHDWHSGWVSEAVAWLFS